MTLPEPREAAEGRSGGHRDRRAVLPLPARFTAAMSSRPACGIQLVAAALLVTPCQLAVAAETALLGSTFKKASLGVETRDMHTPSRLTAGFLGAVLLSACASTSSADFDRRMATYVSGSEVQLVSGLGVPQRVYETEGRRFLQYDFSGSASSSFAGPSVGFGFGSSSGRWGHGSAVGTGISFGFGGPGYYEAVPCMVTFEVRDGRVLNFARQGEGCR